MSIHHDRGNRNPRQFRVKGCRILGRAVYYQGCRILCACRRGYATSVAGGTPALWRWMLRVLFRANENCAILCSSSPMCVLHSLALWPTTRNFFVFLV